MNDVHECGSSDFNVLDPVCVSAAILKAIRLIAYKVLKIHV